MARCSYGRLAMESRRTRVHSRLPALLMVSELLPGGGPLNGRRWAGQQLLKLWLSLAAGQELPLLVPDPVGLGNQIQALLQRAWSSY